MNRSEILLKLGQLFSSEPYKSTYAFRLIHHHYDLKPSEWMVTSDQVTAPEQITTPPNPMVVPDQWAASGEPFENFWLA